MAHINFSLLVAWTSICMLVASSPVLPRFIGNNKVTSFSAADSIARGKLHGPTEYYRTLVKYNLPIPDALKQSADRFQLKMAAKQVGGVPAISEHGDLDYDAPIGLGTPPQQLYLDFDTGSSDTWVFSTDTVKSEVKGQTIWDHNQSSTASVVPNCSWNILYGDFSSSSGICYKDTLSLGNLTIPGMTIESARLVSSQFTRQSEMSGLLGLAWPKLIQTVPVQPSFLSFLPQVVDEPIFTSDLRHNSSLGSYNFGYIDNSLYGSEIQYINISNTAGYWAGSLQSFAPKGTPFVYDLPEKPIVAFDTGSTLMYVPDAVVKAYMKWVPGSGFSTTEYGYTVPCNATLPNFIWELSDTNGTTRIMGEIPGEYLVYSPVDEGDENDAGDGDDSSNTCYAGLQAIAGLTSLQGIFGDVFLKSSFQVWDVGRARIGLAPKELSPSDTSFQARPMVDLDNGGAKRHYQDAEHVTLRLD
ncbi:aspartic peptidase domain-containing protein [Xylariales sp. PMI_506]|nr:aspartic peptidase domain-containing protein [Xylariales sp. PMI_506]